VAEVKDDALLAEMVRRMVEVYRPERIYLLLGLAGAADPITWPAAMMSHRQYEQGILFNRVDERVGELPECALADARQNLRG
jgi:hypothetical protein